MDVIARAECPTHGHRTLGGICVREDKRVCSTCHAQLVRVKYVPASQLRGAVEERDVFARALALACKRFRDSQAFKDDCLRRAGEELHRSGGQ